MKDSPCKVRKISTLQVDVNRIHKLKEKYRTVRPEHPKSPNTPESDHIRNSGHVTGVIKQLAAKKSGESILNLLVSKSTPEHKPIQYSYERELTKQMARDQRLEEMTEDTPGVKEALERLDISFAVLKIRMKNADYDPIAHSDQEWESCCHPDYALMSPEQRDIRFIKTMELVLGHPVVMSWTSRNLRTAITNTRKRVDNIRANYFHYLMVSKCLFLPNVSPRLLIWKGGIDYYRQHKDDRLVWEYEPPTEGHHIRQRAYKPSNKSERKIEDARIALSKCKNQHNG